jgi:hypothetical protein
MGGIEHCGHSSDFFVTTRRASQKRADFGRAVLAPNESHNPLA